MPYRHDLNDQTAPYHLPAYSNTGRAGRPRRWRCFTAVLAACLLGVLGATAFADDAEAGWTYIPGHGCVGLTSGNSCGAYIPGSDWRNDVPTPQWQLDRNAAIAAEVAAAAARLEAERVGAPVAPPVIVPAPVTPAPPRARPHRRARAHRRSRAHRRGWCRHGRRW